MPTHKTRLAVTVEKSGLRRERIAADAEITVSYLRALEAGQHSPSLGVARRLAGALRASIDDLFPAAHDRRGVA